VQVGYKYGNIGVPSDKKASITPSGVNGQFRRKIIGSKDTMSFSCALGLVACLNYNDSTIDWDEAFNIVDACKVINKYPAYDFMGGSHNGKAYYHAEYLWDMGLRFEWNPPYKASSEYRRMEYRKASVLKECHQFRSLYRNINNWKNPNKIPFPLDWGG